MVEQRKTISPPEKGKKKKKIIWKMLKQKEKKGSQELGCRRETTRLREG
jgi:hypothetical protein